VAVGRKTFVVVVGAIVMAVGALTLGPVWALPASAHAVQTSSGKVKATKHCRHRNHKSSLCSGSQSTQTVTGTSGDLTVTFTATETGQSVNFDVESSDTQTYGALGPEFLSFGNGATQGFATPEYCLAHPMAETSDRQIPYTYAKAGTYSASVTVGANCTPDQLTLTLSITVG
jgi:hypothetical protein